MKQIYLDHNATTRIDDEVINAMFECFRAGHVNPASMHAPGRAARRIVEEAREKVGELLDVNSAAHNSDQIIFTSGGTEANNLAMFGLSGTAAGRIIVSSIEHPSVLEAARRQRELGFDIQEVRVNDQGVCDLDHLNSLMNDDTRLVSMMWGNNETGVLQPVEEIAALCNERAVPFHCDAVQCVGKIPVSFRKLNASAMTLTPHKLHGPVGIGALVVRHDVQLAPTLFGGAQQYALRPGTEPVALVVGMAQALQLAVDDPAREHRMRNLRDQFERRMTDALTDCVIIAEQSARLPHTSNIAFPGIDRQAFLMAADIAGLAISSGSACASGSSERSHVLIAMGLDSAIVDSALRISLGAHSTAEEINLAADRIIRIAKDLRRS